MCTAGLRPAPVIPGTALLAQWPRQGLRHSDRRRAGHPSTERGRSGPGRGAQVPRPRESTGTVPESEQAREEDVSRVRVQAVLKMNIGKSPERSRKPGELQPVRWKGTRRVRCPGKPRIRKRQADGRRRSSLG